MTLQKQREIEQRRVKIGTASIYYQVVGTGKPVILVHGLSGSGRWWRNNVGPLAAHFRLYIIDLIGFGQSRGQQGFVLSEAHLILKEWMDRLHIRQASVIGHSMGGLVVANLAADFPERVERLVLVDAVGVPFSHSLLRQVVNMLRAFRYIPFDLLKVMLADAYRAGFMNVLAIGRRLLEQDLNLKLSRIIAPTLVIWGERDKIVPLELGKQLNNQLARSSFVILKGAGHIPMWENVEDFNRVVLDFLTAPDFIEPVKSAGGSGQFKAG